MLWDSSDDRPTKSLLLLLGLQVADTRCPVTHISALTKEDCFWRAAQLPCNRHRSLDQSEAEETMFSMLHIDVRIGQVHIAAHQTVLHPHHQMLPRHQICFLGNMWEHTLPVSSFDRTRQLTTVYSETLSVTKTTVNLLHIPFAVSLTATVVSNAWENLIHV
jgi:hypothetical protein